MKNTASIHSDEICVYISVEVSNPLYGKIALLIADTIIVSAIIVGIVVWLPALILISAVFLAMLGKYTLWNFYGKEYVIVNTKSVSYRHDYGFFKTGLSTVPFKKVLNLQVGLVKPIEDKTCW